MVRAGFTAVRAPRKSKEEAPISGKLGYNIFFSFWFLFLIIRIQTACSDFRKTNVSVKSVDKAPVARY
jgi:hypothetical protein